MRASAAVVAECDPAGGVEPRLVELRSAPPISLRWADGCLYIVGSAFAPVGGDELELDVHVGEGATLTVRTVAASIAQSGNGKAEQSRSRFTVTARVAAGARLHWLPEPGVAARGCHHVNEARLDLVAGAQVTWREEVLLGRSGEPGGEWRSLLEAALDGQPLLYQDTLVGGPAWDSPSVGGGARAAGSLLVVGPEAPTEPAVRTAADPFVHSPDDPVAGRAAVMPLAHPGSALISALASDARTLRQLVDIRGRSQQPE